MHSYASLCMLRWWSPTRRRCSAGSGGRSASRLRSSCILLHSQFPCASSCILMLSFLYASLCILVITSMRPYACTSVCIGPQVDRADDRCRGGGHPGTQAVAARAPAHTAAPDARRCLPAACRWHHHRRPGHRRLAVRVQPIKCRVILSEVIRAILSEGSPYLKFPFGYRNQPPVLTDHRPFDYRMRVHDAFIVRYVHSPWPRVSLAMGTATPSRALPTAPAAASAFVARRAS